ncbi:hypothetical protein C8T65DRAFT_57589 [Cerioporus squamosus]|nr:hypothetical protein C8T65DRAFT_57589 [Cerioporus squamosus]
MYPHISLVIVDLSPCPSLAARTPCGGVGCARPPAAKPVTHPVPYPSHTRSRENVGHGDWALHRSSDRAMSGQTRRPRVPAFQPRSEAANSNTTPRSKSVPVAPWRRASAPDSATSRSQADDRPCCPLSREDRVGQDDRTVVVHRLRRDRRQRPQSALWRVWRTQAARGVACHNAERSCLHACPRRISVWAQDDRDSVLTARSAVVEISPMRRRYRGATGQDSDSSNR